MFRIVVYEKMRSSRRTVEKGRNYLGYGTVQYGTCIAYIAYIDLVRLSAYKDYTTSNREKGDDTVEGKAEGNGYFVIDRPYRRYRRTLRTLRLKMPFERSRLS